MLALARNELLDHRYRIVRWIGQGASAVVYEALDTTLDRPVAIKILNSELISSPMLQARFTQEAEAAIHIDSPFVVAVHAVGTVADGHPYIVMELLDGEDLGHLLERVGALSEERAVEFAIHALSGLAHAHTRGVLHRDIKPDNLVIVRSDSGDEMLKIVDLGISKVVTADESLGLTRTNVVLGSPVYMSPEQARGAKHMDHRSDLFSVGVVLYECLTGRAPHDGDNFNDLMFKIALEDAPDPLKHKPTLDPDLVKIVMKALTRDLDKRFQSASTFREALLEWGAGRGARVPPTPTSSSRMRAPTSRRSRGLEVTLDDDDDVEPSSKSSDAVGTLMEEAVPATATKPADSLQPAPDRTGRRKLGIVLVIAAALGVVVLLVIWGTRTQPPTASAASSASMAASTFIPDTPPIVVAPNTSAVGAASSSKPKTAATTPRRSPFTPRNPNAATPNAATPHAPRAAVSSATNNPPSDEDEADPPED